MSSLNSTRADLVTGVVFLCLGLAAFIGSVRMDRLSERGIDPWTAPGVVPGLLGAVLALLGLTLALRSLKPAEGEKAPTDWTKLRRLATTLGLCLGYALLLVGNLPFWLASMIFVFVFTTLLEHDPADTPRRRYRKLAMAAILAAASGIGIHLLFQELFLVRMP
ncbi:tripartite tricarboxylate transporter TctB family protein [Telmatospirillum sp. J64-1]|uniref:tripartite tricarboxylate transporter TctB family protein n=1 Tax=Telmatospirillum sp. J64-1 TaxID=2502183 RepID=UPI00115E2092|nr:tripartite tricarboxylate transporter TctB family protein [Telmatospirillum sp. J64-1]